MIISETRSLTDPTKPAIRSAYKIVNIDSGEDITREGVSFDTPSFLPDLQSIDYDYNCTYMKNDEQPTVRINLQYPTVEELEARENNKEPEPLPEGLEPVKFQTYDEWKKTINPADFEYVPNRYGTLSVNGHIVDPTPAVTPTPDNKNVMDEETRQDILMSDKYNAQAQQYGNLYNAYQQAQPQYNSNIQYQQPQQQNYYGYYNMNYGNMYPNMQMQSQYNNTQYQQPQTQQQSYGYPSSNFSSGYANNMSYGYGNSYYNGYNNYYGYGYNYNPYYDPNNAGPIFGPHASLLDQSLYQMGFNFNPSYVDENGRPIPLRETPFDTWQRLQQEEQKQHQGHLDTLKMLLKVTRKDAGEDYSDETLDKIVAAQEPVPMNQELSERDKDELEYNHIAWICSQPNTMNTPGLITNPNYRPYVEHYNKIYAQSEKYQSADLYDFLNGGVGNQMMIDMYKDLEKKRAKSLLSLFDPNQFKTTMAQNNPYYDPVKGSFTEKRNTLCLQDMEVKLPKELAESEYNKRRNRFLDSIFAKM